MRFISRSIFLVIAAFTLRTALGIALSSWSHLNAGANNAVRRANNAVRRGRPVSDERQGSQRSRRLGDMLTSGSEMGGTPRVPSEGTRLYGLLLRIDKKQPTVVHKGAGIADGEHYTPHDFKKTFCSDLIRQSVATATVKDLAGHESILTTERYYIDTTPAQRSAIQRRKILRLADVG
jgi:hypothetical protein